MPRPFVLVSHAPTQPTGTSRVAGDLAAYLWAHREALDIDFLHVGSVGWGPLPKTGLPLRLPVAWPVWAYQENVAEGSARALEAAIVAHYTAAGLREPGVVFVVEDPARAFNTLGVKLPAWTRWGYLHVDAHNLHGSLGGPAGHAVTRFDRVLACSPFGQQVLQTLRTDKVPMIPHGYHPETFHAQLTAEEVHHADQILNPIGSDAMVLGCVASNHARKDWGLFTQTLAELRRRGVNIRGWAHIDAQVGEAWSLPQLAKDCGLDWRALVVTTQLTDRELACCYARCVATLAIGRGEGFGYPILESMACGTPAVHVGYGAGADLIPRDWQLGGQVQQLVGPYALLRPLVSPFGAADAIEYVIAHHWTPALPGYHWANLYPQFGAWIQEGLR